MKRRTLSVLLTGLLWVGLAVQGCVPKATPTPLPTATLQPTATRAGVTLTDSLGNTVHFDKLPQRIVIAGKNPLPVIENLFLYEEACDRVVGCSMGGKQNPAAFLGLMHPAFKNKPTLKTDAGPEQITALQPDAVVMKSLNYEALGKPLQSLGIPVVALDLETPEQFARDHAILGQLLGNPARSKEILAFYQAKVAAVTQAMQGLKDGDKPTVLLMQYSPTGGEIAVSVPPASWLQTLEVEMAGGSPVWKATSGGTGWNVVNLEQIAAWDPDAVFVVDYTADSREAVSKLKADARWQALTAVKENKMYGFAGDFFSWDQPDPRWILGVTWLAGKLHPERFPNLNMEQEITEFFVEMYGMDTASVRASVLPKLTGDVK